MAVLDFTHDPDRTSWIESANELDADFPIQNLPFGIFESADGSQNIGVAIGNSILDLGACARKGLLPAASSMAALESTLNVMMSLNKAHRVELRQCLCRLLSTDAVSDRSVLSVALVKQSDVRMRLPCEIGDYTDFYASVFHATNVGSMFRPDQPLLPNYKHIPIGYHGRASSIVVSGTAVKRPVGQKAPADEGGNPTCSPTALLDYEMEVGFFVAEGNELGSTIGIDIAEDRIFGMCLVNDWSARDMQKWEYQPLGPFLAKSFATTISPWIVTMEALIPFRCREFLRPAADPHPLEYLASANNSRSGGVDIQLEVYLSTAKMRPRGMAAQRLSRANFSNMYWTIAQMLAHHASNGCNLRPGDLLASGTVSGPERSERGCLLELTWNGDGNNPLPGSDRTAIELPTGETRKFLEDGDVVSLRGYCDNGKHRPIGFGNCSGMILPAAF